LRKTISSGLANWWTSPPATAQCAAMSKVSDATSIPVSPLGGVAGLIETTSQSPVLDVHAPAGTVTSSEPSDEVTAEDWPGFVFAAVGADCAVPTVKFTWNGVVLPTASRREPVSVCSPLPSAPVLNVSWLPTITGAGTGPSSSVVFGAVTASDACRTIASTDATVAPSAGSELASVGAELSIRIPVTTSEALLSNVSYAVARRS
jgi:hypothetical protein